MHSCRKSKSDRSIVPRISQAPPASSGPPPRSDPERFGRTARYIGKGECMNTLDWVPLIFDRVVAATISASALAIGIAFLQWCFGARLNAAWRFSLWSVVMVRLLIPVFPQSPASLFNLARLWNTNSPTHSAQHAPATESPTLASRHRLESKARSVPQLRSPSPLASAISHARSTSGFLAGPSASGWARKALCWCTA